ncbi:hypothetical protein FGG08_002001 [Glutinoglossum americanum]|uniref:Uncharacterized protein n=1 Tax=Glutinoglossum americanum TaxID=1670608 RepID=A0A9P8IFW7_9PEZI|nr:hypothetical protein FGG08_002001 [Glutinoglossum americanum]
MKTFSPAFSTLVVLTFISLAWARTEGQFRHFFDNWSPMLREILASNCSEPYAELSANPQVGGYGTVACILQYMSEARKAEMAITSVMFGLLPAVLQLIGPRVSDVSTLGLQRPILALLICLGSSSATLENERTGMEISSQSQDKPLWPKRLIRPPLWLQIGISLCEYAIVMTAAANCILQAYQLSFWAVTLVSTITGTFGNTIETFSPLLWVFLALPIHLLGLYALHIAKTPTSQTGAKLGKPTWRSRISGWVIQELTPCAFAKIADTQPAKLKPSYRLLVLNWMIRIGVWVHVIYGTIVLSSILFISLFEALRLMSRFFVGTFACRIVIAFELYGLQVVSREN